MEKEMLEKAKGAKSAEELKKLAAENNVQLTDGEAEEYFAKFSRSGELSDEELDNVAGGCHTKDGRLVVSVDNDCHKWRCKKCGGYAHCEVEYVASHTCVDGKRTRICCNECKYMSYERGLWLCNNPNN